MSNKTIISLDLGATKCAAGIVNFDAKNNDYTCERDTNIKLTDTNSFDDLIHQLEAQLDIAFKDADAVCIGAAGQYNGETIHHLDGVYPYPLPIAQTAKTANWQKHAVIHDYDSIVCATFTSYMQDTNNVSHINTSKIHPHKRRVALGLGTGLGLKDGVLLANGDFWLGKNEIGHIGIVHPPAASNELLARHLELLKYMRSLKTIASHLPITFENILTGRGLLYCHNFIYSENLTSPEEVGNKIAQQQTPELLDLYAWYLGLFIGTVQLTFMPEGGIWVTGGVAINNLSIFDNDNLHAGIMASPAYREERTHHPLGVLKNPKHALIGAGYYAVNKLLA